MYVAVQYSTVVQPSSPPFLFACSFTHSPLCAIFLRSWNSLSFVYTLEWHWSNSCSKEDEGNLDERNLNAKYNDFLLYTYELYQE